MLKRNPGAHRIDGVAVAVEFDAPQRGVALGLAGPEARRHQVRGTCGDRHRRLAVRGTEMALGHCELEPAAVDLDAV